MKLNKKPGTAKEPPETAEDYSVMQADASLSNEKTFAGKEFIKYSKRQMISHKTEKTGSANASSGHRDITFRRKGRSLRDQSSPTILSLSILISVILLAVIYSAVMSFFTSDISAGILSYPFDDHINVGVTSPFGYRTHPIYGTVTFHSGVDFGTPHHAPIYAAADGTVIFADVNGGYGNCIRIEHCIDGIRITTLYAHLSQILVSKGDTVLRGQMIGIEGGSMTDDNHGVSTGHHLHFEVRDQNGQAVDPFRYLLP